MNKVIFERIKIEGNKIYHIPEESNKKTLLSPFEYDISYSFLSNKLIKNISLKNDPETLYSFAYNKKTGEFNKEYLFATDFLLRNKSVDFERFYLEFVKDLLIPRFVLGYITRDVKPRANDKHKFDDGKIRTADNYLRMAHKYKMKDKFHGKYNLQDDEISIIINELISKTFIPQEFWNGLMNEFRKVYYDGEFNHSQIFKIEKGFKKILMNSKDKVPLGDNVLLNSIIVDLKYQSDKRDANAAFIQKMANIIKEENKAK